MALNERHVHVILVAMDNYATQLSTLRGDVGRSDAEGFGISAAHAHEVIEARLKDICLAREEFLGAWSKMKWTNGAKEQEATILADDEP